MNRLFIALAIAAVTGVVVLTASRLMWSRPVDASGRPRVNWARPKPESVRALAAIPKPRVLGAPERARHERMCVRGVSDSCQILAMSRADSPFDDGIGEGSAPPAARSGDPIKGLPARKLDSQFAIDPGALKVARAMAKASADCRKARSAACRTVNANGREGLKILQKTRLTLKEACGLRHMEACFHMGELAGLELDTAAAAGWYEKSRLIAANIQSRCRAKVEKDLALCRRAGQTLDRLASGKAR